MRPKAYSFSFVVSIIFLNTILLSTSVVATNIMPLGDSITRGTNADISDPNYIVGYRQTLYLDLTDAGYDVDFVGGEQEGASAVPAFDIDHEGHGGWEASGGIGGGLAANVFDWLVANPADIVLLHIGTNDISDGEIPADIVSEVDQILDEIFLYDPEIIVILARIINRQSWSADTNEFNNLLPGMVNAHTNLDNIILVNQETALNYVDDMSENTHPNALGYSKMADVWFSALENILPDPNPPNNPSSDEGKGGCFIGTASYGVLVRP